jgi:hypothetical protein
MASVNQFKATATSTIATPANQSALQKTPDFEEDFATYQPCSYLHLPTKGRPT